MKITCRSIQIDYDKNDKILCISNHSPWNLIISIKPIPPKRKIFPIIVIQPDTFKMWPDSPLDQQYLMFHFDMKEKDGR